MIKVEVQVNKVTLKCNPGYKKQYGDDKLLCGTNLPGTEGVWLTQEFLQI